MKDIMKSLKDNATSRLKNPIVGAFVLSWTALNINGVSLFLMVDTATKIQMVKAKNWVAFDDLIAPLSVGIFYLLLLPLLNMGYEYINDGVINYRRNKNKSQTDKKLFIERKETVKAKIEADEVYIRKLKDKEIEGWLEEQSKRNSEFIALKERYSQLVNDGGEDKKKSLSAQTELRSQMYTANENIKRLESEAQKSKQAVEREANTIEKTIKNIQNEGFSEDISNDLNVLLNSVAELRFKFGLWDEDIPF